MPTHPRRPHLLAAVLAALCLALPAAARTLEVGPDKTLKLPSEAAAAATDGDRIAIAPGEYFDCAVWHADNLIIEGTGRPEDTVITDKTCNGKALFLTDGEGITIRNLTLTRARVPDGNGAGIRMQAANLTIEHVRFVNNQNGILSNIEVGGSLIVRDSEFLRNGICNPGCSHGIYTGRLDLLRIERSTFLETHQAHHIKSRARRTEVIDSTLQDGPNGTASYQIEAPNGGSVLVRGCTIEKGPNAENHAGAIAIGMEAITQPTRDIIVENNTFRVDGGYTSYLVLNQTATDAVLTGNRLSNSAKALRGDGAVQ